MHFIFETPLNINLVNSAKNENERGYIMAGRDDSSI